MSPAAGRSVERGGFPAFRPLTSDEAASVPTLWRTAWPSGQDLYPLEQRVWDERLGQHHDQGLLLGAFVDNELVAATLGRLPTAPWLPSDVGWVSLLAVVENWQGQGVGSSLLRELLSVLRARGAKRFRLGSDANHLFPGLPSEAPPALWRLARRAGASFTAAEHDLLIDLRLPLPAAPLAPGWRVRTDDPAGALEFVTRTFPGRWAHEIDSYLAAGVTVMTLERTDVANPVAEGFCALFEGTERLIGPSLYWRGSLSNRASGASIAGMGPLGIAGGARGHGLGLALVRAGAEWLQSRGATDLVINWTTLTSFYGKLGARVWRTYQRAEGPL